MLDEITQAVLAREEVVEVPAGRPRRKRRQARASGSSPTSTSSGPRSGYSIYRALQHPLYPILRKIERIGETLHHVVKAATRGGRVVYASNHRSHTDYLVEPLVLDDNGIRPPIIAAGINLFGGPLGLIHRHVTGAIPIRRNTKDPAYLITLKAYVAELLQKHDLFFYPEGGRSYSGELKTPKTGPDARRAAAPSSATSSIVPTAVVLRPGARGSRARAAAGQASAAAVQPRAGGDGALRGRLPVARVRHVRRADRRRRRRSAVAHATCSISRTRSCATIGRLYKVLPTAVCRRRDAAVDHAARSRGAHRSRSSRTLRAHVTPTWACTSGAEAVDEAAEPLETRGISSLERGRVPRSRSQRAALLRAVASTSARAPPGRTAAPSMLDDRVRSRCSTLLSRSATLKRLASRYGMRTPTSFARRFIAGETVEEAIEAARALQAQGLLLTLDYLGESVAHASTEADAATREYLRRHRRHRRSQASNATSR